MENKTLPTKKSIFSSVAEFFRQDLVRYIINRILLFFPTILLITIIIFFVIQLPPGDYVSTAIAKLQQEGEEVSAETAQEMRESYGLDQPVIVQYGLWVKDIIWTGSNTTYYRLYNSHHNWKYSFSYQTNVWNVIGKYLPMTVTITLLTMLLQYLIAIPVAVYSATHQYSVGDYTISVLTFTGSAIPGFIFAILCMYLSFLWTGNANVGMFTQDMLLNGINWGNFGEFMKRMTIPFIVFGFAGTCGTIRSVRAQMLDEISQQYTLTARAKGVSERKIIWKYCFRAAINPTVTGLGTSLSHLFSGSTVTAMVLNLSILGPVLFHALQYQDMYLAGAIVMVQAILVEVGVLLADIGIAFLDPRIRYSGGSR